MLVTKVRPGIDRNMKSQVQEIQTASFNEAFCISLCTNTLEQGVKSSFAVQTLDKIVEQIGLSRLDWATFQEEGREPSQPYYLPNVEGRIVWFKTFPRILTRCEMKTASSRNWSRVKVSISYEDNHYTTSVNIHISIFVNKECSISVIEHI